MYMLTIDEEKGYSIDQRENIQDKKCQNNFETVSK